MRYLAALLSLKAHTGHHEWWCYICQDPIMGPMIHGMQTLLSHLRPIQPSLWGYTASKQHHTSCTRISTLPRGMPQDSDNTASRGSKYAQHAEVLPYPHDMLQLLMLSCSTCDTVMLPGVIYASNHLDMPSTHITVSLSCGVTTDDLL